MEAILKEIYDGILSGESEGVPTNVQKAIDAQIAPEHILTGAMIAAMSEVGHLFEAGEYYVPEMLISARAMKAGMAVLKPYLVQSGVASTGKIVVGTVKGDLHDIGKNLVCMMLEGAAFEIVDLGTDVSPEKFVEAVRSTGAQIVAMSALLTTTMGNMETTIEALKEAGLRDNVKVMIGGAPVTQTFANEIGADAFAPDASRAVTKAKELVGKA